MLDKLKILGHEYQVIKDPDIQLDYDHSAQLDSKKCNIRVGAHLVVSRQEECLIHEIIEALNYHLELKLDHPRITQIGEGLYQVLKDNGLLRIP